MEQAATDKPPLVVEEVPVDPSATPDTLPRSCGPFKPVGHAGWPRDQLLRFAEGTAVVELQSLIANADANATLAVHHRTLTVDELI